MAGADNPFERYGLDPREGIVAITQRLKELAEDATDDAERERIREAWEELTLHPARRLRAALNAHPETRAPLGSPPMLGRVRVVPTELELRDLAARPSALAALPPEIADPQARADVAGVDAPPLDADELF
ncbi:MAG: hypothetical protein JWO86_5528 [Myxococcaceae bacterium]|nr:hypothetical protein [Myxococcaceae bacterium]